MGLKYHCPNHPDKPPHCSIGDYTPCKECYQKYRRQKLKEIENDRRDKKAG
jgi:hypothetical protein